MNTERIDYLKSAGERLPDNSYIPEGLIDFYTKIFEFQKKVYDSTIEDTPVMETNTPEEGYPLLKSDSFKQDAAIEKVLEKSLRDLSGIITAYNPDMNFDHMRETLTSSDHTIVSFFKHLVSHDFETLEKISGELKIMYEGFIFLLINSAKPVLSAVRTSSGIECPGEDWLEPHCPFCGYLPDFASIREKDDNRIFLHCGLCEMQWRFRRLTCHHCENNEYEELISYQSEIDELHTIYCCKKCRAYIKIFKIPKMREIKPDELFAENIISNYLDATAIDMGYARP